MKASQYLRQEKAIAVGAADDIERRWKWGLRLLHDPQAFAKGSSQLRPGVSDGLVKSARACGFKLSESEIRWRLQCARAYPSETAIRCARSEYRDWWSLCRAGFPPVDVSPDEPPADHQTDTERDQDRAAALMDLIGDQGSLFSLRDFEPTTSTLADLRTYTDEGKKLTARFARHDAKREEYMNRLEAAANGDMSMTWLEAHSLLPTGADADARL